MSSGLNATNATESNFLGAQSGNGATNASHSNFFGTSSGVSATNASYSNFIGDDAGDTATNATQSNFFGKQAGNHATNASYSNFIGSQAGNLATGAHHSNFLGYSSGNSASSANNSNFFGENAGDTATNASNSNFFGQAAGYTATNASLSTFIGISAGSQATNAKNAIFIGTQAGVSDTVDNTTVADDYSILIGPNTLTNGNKNSIALGSYATNTASNQFMIGSSTRPIEEMDIIGSAGQTCTVRPDTAGINCTSDENLKTNIADLTSTLDLLKNIRIVSYNWKNTPTINPQIGFLAQNLKQYFPTLVSTASNGYLQVNYAGMTPILTKAVQEMNIKIEGINNLEKENTFRDSLIAWFANAANRITRIFTGELCLTDIDGTSECINKSELHNLKQLLNTQTPPPNLDPVPTPDPVPDPVPLPPQDPVIPDKNSDPTPNQDSTPGDTPPSDTQAPAN